MKVYLSGKIEKIALNSVDYCTMNRLLSFVYVKKWEYEYIERFHSFMLDSGAFTFMGRPDKSRNYHTFLHNYIDFINNYDIKLFFELDLDNLIGVEETYKLTRTIESKTSKQPIPVWHKIRGKERFIDLCKNYPYVSISGVAKGDNVTTADFAYYNALCELAHTYGCKIHCLGFTPTNLSGYKFDSVDSSSCTYGVRFGFLHQFDGNKIIKIKRPRGTRTNSAAAEAYNIKQWLNYANYLEQNG